MRTIIWSLPAREDLFRIAAHYREINADLPATLLGRIRDATDPLILYPHLGEQTGRAGTRRWRVKRTPFILFYSATPSTIRIARVRHAAEDWSAAP